MYKKRYEETDVVSLYCGGYLKSFYLREISRLAKISLKTTQNLISKLEEKRILKSEARGKNKYFRLNLENIQTKHYIVQSEIKKTIMFLEKHPIFKTFLKEINTDAMIVVFGSFAKKTLTKDSDIDLLIVPEKRLPLHFLPNKVHKVELSNKGFIRAVKSRETLIKEIEDNHIILNNHSLFVNTMWGHYAEQKT